MGYLINLRFILVLLCQCGSQTMSKSPSDLRQVVNGSPLRRPMVASCLKSIGAPGGELRETLQVVHEFVWKKTRDVLTLLSTQALLLVNVDCFAKTFKGETLRNLRKFQDSTPFCAWVPQPGHPTNLRSRDKCGLRASSGNCGQGHSRRRHRTIERTCGKVMESHGKSGFSLVFLEPTANM